jgi:hypothetical protein
MLHEIVAMCTATTPLASRARLYLDLITHIGTANGSFSPRWFRVYIGRAAVGRAVHEGVFVSRVQ